MPPARDRQQLEKLPQQPVRLACLVLEAVAFCASKSSAGYRPCVGGQTRPTNSDGRFEGVKGKRLRGPQREVCTGFQRRQPKLDVSQTFPPNDILHVFKKFPVVLRASHQRFTMIGKWNRDESASSQPTVDTANDKTIREFLVRWCGRKRNRLVAIGLPKGLEPARCVKDRCARMTPDKSPPSAVLQRIKTQGSHG